MKFFINIFFVFYIVLKPLVPIIDYEIRYNYISEKLCINKTRSELNCNGKCYVKKEISENHDLNTETKNVKINLSLESFIINDIVLIKKNLLLIVNNLKFNFKPLFYSFDIDSSIFHPPLI